MIVQVLLGSQAPAQIDHDKIKVIFPYGFVSVESRFGGLDVRKPDGEGKTIIVTAALIISFDMEEIE